MSDDLPFVRHPDQPPDDIEFQLADGVFVKQMYLKSAGMIVPQHAHTYSHHSMLAAGSVRVWKDGALVGDFTAPHPLFIEAGAKHRFESLVPETIVYCIHNVERTGHVDVDDDHQIIGEKSCLGV